MRICENYLIIDGKSLSVRTSTLSSYVYAFDIAKRAIKIRTLNI